MQWVKSIEVQCASFAWLSLKNRSVLFIVRTTHFCLLLGFSHLLGRCQFLCKCNSANQIILYGTVHCNAYGTSASLGFNLIPKSSKSCTLKMLRSGNIIVQPKSNVEVHGPSFEDTPWFTRVCVNSITGLEMQRLPCVCERPRAHEGGRGPLWITTVFWSRVEHSSAWIRGAHKTRQGKAMQPVKSCHLPATMGSCVKRGTGVAAGSCHVCIFGFCNSLRVFEETLIFSLMWARKLFPVPELVLEAIFSFNWGISCFNQVV